MSYGNIQSNISIAASFSYALFTNANTDGLMLFKSISIPTQSR